MIGICRAREDGGDDLGVIHRGTNAVTFVNRAMASEFMKRTDWPDALYLQYNALKVDLSTRDALNPLSDPS